MARNDKRGKANLDRALSRSNEALANHSDLFEMYIYAQQAEGTAKGTLMNKRRITYELYRGEIPPGYRFREGKR